MKRVSIITKYCNGFFLLLGAVLSTLGLALLLYFPSIYDYIIHSALDLRPNTEAYKAWSTNDPPLILDFYFFNWTNPEQVYNPKVKPHFEQVGPYRFLEIKEKYNISFHDNDTVSFRFVKKYHFMKDESPKPLTDVINTINPVATSAAYKSRFFNPLKKMMLSFGISSTSKVYVTKTIDELLFTGYDDPLLDIVRSLAIFMPEGANVSDKFGWFYERNNSYVLSGDFSMHTGHDENFGKLLSWNYKNRTSYYEGTCGEIRGSAGEFHPIDRERDFIEIYSSEMCSYAHLQYEEDVTVKGIKAYKYSSDILFDNGTEVPENACFCNGECIPSGVLNISSCRMDTPMFISLPHFYNADPYYLEPIEGLKPSKEKHDFYITLEPKSAIVVDIAARMQLNVLMQPVPGFSLFKGVPKIFVPVFFFDQVVTVTDDLAVKMQILQNLPDIRETASYILIIIGVVFMMSTLYCWVNSKKTQKLNRNEYKISPQSIADEIPLKLKTETT